MAPAKRPRKGRIITRFWFENPGHYGPTLPENAAPHRGKTPKDCTDCWDAKMAEYKSGQIAYAWKD